jgi:hypothetical protein
MIKEVSGVACELIENCHFFNHTIKDFPKTSRYLIGRLCHGNHQSCTRYRVFKEKGVDHIPPDLVPAFVEEVEADRGRRKYLAFP